MDSEVRYVQMDEQFYKELQYIRQALESLVELFREANDRARGQGDYT